MVDPLPDQKGKGMVLVTLSPEIHLKSPRTRRRFRRLLSANLRSALVEGAPGASLVEEWDRMTIVGGIPEAVARVAATVFGVQRAQLTQPITFDSLEELAAQVARAAGHRVRGQTFSVRVRRRGTHPWRSIDAERLIGSYLLGGSAGVDLRRPQVEVRVLVRDGEAHLVREVVEGPGGLPLGSQARGLVLLSGGFDSAVAAWLLMRRGSSLDFVHFSLDCAQSEHALAVAHLLHRRWGHGSHPLVHVIDFESVKDALLLRVDSRLRQVVLKQLMMQAASHLAGEYRLPVLVTGESVGQVSSQTIEHLAAIDRSADRMVLRPLAGLGKQEIIDWSRRIGTHDLSARAKEVCNLAEGPVAVAARPAELVRAGQALPEGLVAGALAGRRLLAVEDWMPGDPLLPVVTEAPSGVPMVEAGDGLPEVGPVALSGPRAPWIGSRLHRQRRQVWVVDRGAMAASSDVA